MRCTEQRILGGIPVYWVNNNCRLVRLKQPQIGFVYLMSSICLQLPSDSVSRRTPLLLANGWRSPAPVRNFHPIGDAHAGRTTEKGFWDKSQNPLNTWSERQDLNLRPLPPQGKKRNLAKAVFTGAKPIIASLLRLFYCIRTNNKIVGKTTKCSTYAVSYAVKFSVQKETTRWKVRPLYLLTVWLHFTAFIAGSPATPLHPVFSSGFFVRFFQPGFQT